MLLLIEQLLNGLQLGLLLFLLAAGLTLVFGIMDLVNLAHGSLYMLGAYFAATFTTLTGSFLGGVVLALAATLLVGMAVEVIAMRRLYGRDHLDHVLGTFGLILFFNELVRLIWGPAGMNLTLPPWLNTSVQILPGVHYSMYRLSIIVVALVVAFFLYLVIMRTRIGMLVRAGASNREMIGRARHQHQAALHLRVRRRRGARGPRRPDAGGHPHRPDRHGREHPDPRLRRHHHRRHRLDPRRVRGLDPRRPGRHRRPRLPAPTSSRPC